MAKIFDIHNQDGIKNTHELFRTPEYVYKDLYDYAPHWFKGLILDPSAGDGRMVKYIIKQGNVNKHLIVDIRKEELKTWRGDKHLSKCRRINADFLNIKHEQLSKNGLFNCCITNPPFSIAQSFVEHTFPVIKENGYICIFQSMQWLGTQRRTKWLSKAGLYKVLVVPKRPRFEVTGKIFKGTNTFDYSWYVFKKGYKRNPRIDWLIND